MSLKIGLELFLKQVFNCPLNVGRRGKPSTWLPRQKLAEERKVKRSHPLSQKRFLLQRGPLQQRPFVQQRPLSATAVAAMVLRLVLRQRPLLRPQPLPKQRSSLDRQPLSQRRPLSMAAVNAASDDWRSFRRVFSMSVNNDYLHENSISEALM